MALESTQPLTEMSTRRPVRKTDNLTTPSCAAVMKSGNLNFLEPSEPLQACNGTALTLYIYNINLAYTSIFHGEGWGMKPALCKCGDLLIQLSLVPNSITCGYLPPLHIGIHGVLVFEETLATITQTVEYLGCEMHDRGTNLDSQERLENSSFLVYQDQSWEPSCTLSSIEGPFLALKWP